MKPKDGDYEVSLDYTPSLKRTEACIVTKVRRIRPPCRIEVSIGQRVDAGSTLAVLEEPGQGHMIVLGETEFAMPMDVLLANLGYDHIRCVVKRVGEHVSKGEVLARRKPLGLGARVYRSPFDGVVYILREPGVVGIRETREVKVSAFVPGEVSYVIPDREIAVETVAALVQGTYGIGSETHGELRLITDAPTKVARIDDLTPDCRGKVLVCGASVEPGFLPKARDIGVKGVVVASLNDDELASFLGYGPSMITGHERAGLTLMMTEGFGKIPMLDATYDILRKFEGKTAFLNGATQMRAGVIRPEVVVPRDDLSLEQFRNAQSSNMRGLKRGMRVRVLGGDYFGKIGVIRDVSPNLSRLETESDVQVLEVELDGFGLVVIPKSNVEPIE
jgi:hypothetical protein